MLQVSNHLRILRVPCQKASDLSSKAATISRNLPYENRPPPQMHRSLPHVAWLNTLDSNHFQGSPQIPCRKAIPTPLSAPGLAANVQEVGGIVQRRDGIHQHRAKVPVLHAYTLHSSETLMGGGGRVFFFFFFFFLPDPGALPFGFPLHQYPQKRHAQMET